MAAYDGSIKIDTSIDSKGFSAGVSSMRDRVASLGRWVSSVVNNMVSGFARVAKILLITAGIVGAVAAAFLLLKRNATAGAFITSLQAKFSSFTASLKSGLIPTLKTLGKTLVSVVKSPQFFQYVKLATGAFIALKTATRGVSGGMKSLKSSTAGMGGILSSIKGVLVGLLPLIGLTQLFSFGKDAVAEASKMASSLVGLQSVVEGTGNSFNNAQDFINRFTSDGLVPAADAIRAYKNLLLRGYDTTQIEQTLTALKDSASFARASHLTLGEAIATASEGLKNENSILVDNAGVSKNVSVLWKEYAESIGTTVDKLTQQQKIQAEVNGIMRETRFQTGDAAKLSNTYAGQVSALGVSLTNLKVAVGNTFIPIIQTILPYIRAAIDGLTTFFTKLAVIMSVFFGIDMQANAKAAQALAEGTQEASDAQADLADNTTKATKAAKGALAAFDQLNVLQQDAADISPEVGGKPEIALPIIDTQATDDSLQALKDKVSGFKEKLMELLGPALEAFDRLKEKLAPLGELIKKGLGWAWENILVPFGKWAIESFLPVFIDLLAAGFEFLGKVLEALSPVFGFLWENIIKPFGQFLGGFILDAMRGWILIFQELSDWLASHPDLFGTLIESAKEAWNKITETFSLVKEWFLENVVVPIKSVFVTAFLGIGEIIKFVFGTALDWVQHKFESVFTTVIDIARWAINHVIDFLNGMLSGITEGFNAVVGIGSVVGIEVPQFSAPKIPRLATGAVIPPNAEFAAILGDQRSGKNIEAPETLIRQIIREELGGASGDVTVPFTIQLDGETIYKSVKKASTRHGKSLISGGVV